MADHQITQVPKIYLTLADGQNIEALVIKFEWKSFTNGGYIIKARCMDNYWTILQKFATDTYLKDGRKGPTKVVWELSWEGVGSTGKHTGFMTNLHAVGDTGVQSGGSLDFIAVDPPTYWLNAGDSAGKAYVGNVSSVIKQVCNDYFVNPNGKGDVRVSDTDDDKKGVWHMMRMSPKTFVNSLLNWSSSLSDDKTNWIVSSSGPENSNPELWILRQAEKDSKNYGTYIFNTNTPGANDIIEFELMTDNFISVYQKQLITSGLSSVSERYFDRVMDKDRKIVHVYDENTSKKKMTQTTAKTSFTKPSGVASPGSPHEWSTSVMSVPQHSGGDIGVSFDKYIDGTARQQFLNMLGGVMKLRIRVFGEFNPDLAVCHHLGVSKLKIIWKSLDDQYFLDGDWMVYGFYHNWSISLWYTDIYCYRIDYNASAQVV